jgi:hypothetical protein
MRVTPYLIAAAMAACGHTAPQGSSTSLPPRGSAADGTSDDLPIRCEPNGNLVARGETSGDVPLLTLYERDAWHSGFDVPSLLMWSDGTVVYGEGKYGESLRLMQTPSTTWQVRDTVQATIRRLRDAPGHTEITNWTDQQTVQIIFRDGDAWRVVEVYGLTREVSEKSAPEAVRDVVAAYHALLDARPSLGVPAPTNYRRPERWPESLPTFRGQLVIDDLSYCAYKRDFGSGD